MAYNGAGLAGPIYLGGALGAHSIWIYDTLDNIGTVTGSNYFNDPVAPRKFQVGDLVLVNIWATAIGAGGTLSSQTLCYVSGVVATSALYPAEVNASYDGAATVTAWSTANSIQNNWTASVDPTAAADSSAGYAVGSQWFNATSGNLWVAKSVGVGAAVWVNTNAITYTFTGVDLHTAANAISFVPGFKFQVEGMTSVDSAITTTLGAATTLTLKNGSTAMTGGAITMATGDVTGTTRSAMPTALNTGSASDTLNVAVATIGAASSVATVTLVLNKTT